MIANFGEILSAIAAVVFLAVSALGLGGWCERGWRDFPGLGQGERAALRLLAGLGALGLLLFLLGQVSFSVPVIGTVLLAAALLNLRSPPARLRVGKVSPPLLFAGAIVLLCAISGLDRPIGDINSDAISYHLLGPVVWLREGKIAPVLAECLTAFPATVEVLFAAVRAISNERASGVVGALFFAPFLLQIRGLARLLGASPGGAGLAAALFAGMPALTSTIDQCFVDLPYAALILAAARLAFAGCRPQHFGLAGVFAGFAAGTKYFALPTICLLALLILFSGTAPRSARWRQAAIFVACSALAGGAWYLRNWIVLGNPIYPPPPALWRLLPTPTFPLESSKSLMAYMLERGAGLGKAPHDLLLLPFRLTFRTAWFHGGGGLGLGLLAFVPIGFVLAWKIRGAGVWGAFAVGLTVFWFYADQELRFLGLAVGILAAFAGLGGAALFERRGLGRWLALAIIAISLGVGGALAARSRVAVLRALVSPTAAEARYRAGAPHLAAFAFLNAHPEVRKIFITNPYVPAYYLEKNYTVLRGRWGELPHLDAELGADPAVALGCSHILDVDSYGAGFRLPEPGPGRLVYADKTARIYALPATTIP